MACLVWVTVGSYYQFMQQSITLWVDKTIWPTSTCGLRHIKRYKCTVKIRNNRLSYNRYFVITGTDFFLVPTESPLISRGEDTVTTLCKNRLSFSTKQFSGPETEDNGYNRLDMLAMTAVTLTAMSCERPPSCHNYPLMLDSTLGHFHNTAAIDDINWCCQSLYNWPVWGQTASDFLWLCLSCHYQLPSTNRT